ncbi:MAG: TlpA family protein disulfide reductase [Chitinophagaceae bacterium]|nr:TlpA family protein disulfide reductase [Chitinophagaceae bacterium]
MKKFINVLCAIIIGVAIFTLSSYSNTTGNVLIIHLSFIIPYFLSGYIIANYFNSKEFILGFTIPTALLSIITLILGTSRWIVNIPNIIFLVTSFLIGYYFLQLILKKKILSITSLLFLLITWTYVRPAVVFTMFDKKIARVESNTIMLSSVLLNSTDEKTNLVLEQGKVYLIDFYFKNCKPCLIKDPVLAKLKQNIDNENFSVIYIQDGSIDSYETFLEICREKGGNNRFYDINGALCKKLKIEGYPSEIVIDKKGLIRYSSTGFGNDLAKYYLTETKKRVQNLLNEK